MQVTSRVQRPSSLQTRADLRRPEVPGAIAAARGAGIRVVTGDHAGTAAAVARSIGLGTDAAVTRTGLARPGTPALVRQTATAAVFARVTSAGKLAIVESLQRAGHVEAVTGDGINDTPALARVDIGVAAGDGTDVAREAADMILADDNFATIAAAVAEGRHLFITSQRAGIHYYLACKITLADAAAAGLIVGQSRSPRSRSWCSRPRPAGPRRLR